jgi:hypothetical protein
MLYQEHDDVGICRWQADFEPEDCHVVALLDMKIKCNSSVVTSGVLGKGEKIAS